MRIAMLGLVAATAAMCAGCSPAVGSPEWCTQIQKNPPNLMSLTEEQANGIQKCMERAFEQAGKSLGQ